MWPSRDPAWCVSDILNREIIWEKECTRWWWGRRWAGESGLIHMLDHCVLGYLGESAWQPQSLGPPPFLNLLVVSPLIIPRVLLCGFQCCPLEWFKFWSYPKVLFISPFCPVLLDLCSASFFPFTFLFLEYTLKKINLFILLIYFCCIGPSFLCPGFL